MTAAYCSEMHVFGQSVGILCTKPGCDIWRLALGCVIEVIKEDGVELAGTKDFVGLEVIGDIIVGDQSSACSSDEVLGLRFGEARRVTFIGLGMRCLAPALVLGFGKTGDATSVSSDCEEDSQFTKASDLEPWRSVVFA